MRRYEIKMTTRATVTVTVDASDADEACDMAVDYLDDNDIELDSEWDIVDVCQISARD
jgi:hypothetical protein